MRAFLFCAVLLFGAHAGASESQLSREASGYQGIWFTLGQFSKHGDKYSGGLGTYTANHNPMAVYAPQVNKTFFVYGGTRPGERHLLAMAGSYDHRSGKVSRPVVVHDKNGVDDPHDNPSMSIDPSGRIWLFVSGRAQARPGFIYRSVRPYDLSGFERLAQREFTYPQTWWFPGQGCLFLFTKYTRGRELYWATSPDGVQWTPDAKLAGIGGHYQVSGMHSNKVGSFFNRHPGGNVDRRTDLYYVETTDFGKTWRSADGQLLSLPLKEPNNPARVFDYSAQGKLMYTLDLSFEADGKPVLLYIVSRGYQPGPESGPREWTVARWTGASWERSVVCTSDHNYDLGSLYITGSEWRIIGPTEPGPQPGGTGGDVAVWVSKNRGQSWNKERIVTRGSTWNHSYVRRPLNAEDPFWALWADGNPNQFSPSRLYFGNSNGKHYWQLPETMDGGEAKPLRRQ